jgi:PKD repeat protein
VSFDGRGSTDPEGGSLRYEWDLDGDGAFDDSTAAAPTFTYASNGSYAVRLRVTDPGSLQGTASTTIVVGNSRPTAVIDTPATTLRWRVGQTYTFSGHANDPEQGTLPAAALTWSILLNHCSTPTSCHQHPLRDYPGTASGSFTAPDHEYPSFLTLRLTARDSGGLTHQVEQRLDPQAVTVTLATQPAGLRVALGGETFVTPATRTVIVGSHLTIAAVTPQGLSGVTYGFSGWSDGGAATHAITAPATPVTYTATFVASRPSAFPPGWTWRDIGTHGAAATAAYSAGVFTVTNAGVDIWNTADGFTYAYRTLVGDGEIVARVRTVAGVEPWTKAGVMIRESTAAGSPHAFMLTSVGKGMAFQRRRSAGALSEHTTAVAAGGAPRWVRLRRAGNVITAATSADGLVWNTVGSATFSMPASVLVGLGLTSHTTAASASASFDSVRVNSVLPSGWSTRDIGPVGIDGSTTMSGSTMTVHGAGADIWGTSDAFRYAYRALSGDGQVTAHVGSVTGGDPWTKAGVMIRSSLSASSSHALLLVSTGRGVAFQRRQSPGASSLHTAVDTGVAPKWLRLSRSGSLVTAWVSDDGASWVAVATDTVALGTTVYVGLAVTSHDIANLAAATFDNVQVDGP